MPPPSSDKTLLLIGASRGLGFALAAEYLERGWRVVATERDGATSKLSDLVRAAEGRLEIENVDIVYPDQVAALRARLVSRKFDMLFVNAGIGVRETIADVSTDEFIRVIVTNALSPMRVVEILQDLVLPIGTIGIMSSGQGSITNNENGNYEVYRASKAALNMLMLAAYYTARHADDPQNPAAHGAGLGADRSRRPTSASDAIEEEHTESREYDGRAGRKKRAFNIWTSLGRRKVPW